LFCSIRLLELRKVRWVKIPHWLQGKYRALNQLITLNNQLWCLRPTAIVIKPISPWPSKPIRRMAPTAKDKDSRGESATLEIFFISGLQPPEILLLQEEIGQKASAFRQRRRISSGKPAKGTKRNQRNFLMWISHFFLFSSQVETLSLGEASKTRKLRFVDSSRLNWWVRIRWILKMPFQNHSECAPSMFSVLCW